MRRSPEHEQLLTRSPSTTCRGGGSVADAADGEADPSALQALNDKLHVDVRIDPCVLPIGDGLAPALKR